MNKSILFSCALLVGSVYAAERPERAGEGGLVEIPDALAGLLPPGMRCIVQEDPATGHKVLTYTFDFGEGEAHVATAEVAPVQPQAEPKGE